MRNASWGLTLSGFVKEEPLSFSSEEEVRGFSAPFYSAFLREIREFYDYSWKHYWSDSPPTVFFQKSCLSQSLCSVGKAQIRKGKWRGESKSLQKGNFYWVPHHVKLSLWIREAMRGWEDRCLPTWSFFNAQFFTLFALIHFCFQ